MESLVVYDSKFGNTKKLAEIIAEALKPHGAVQLYGLDQMPSESLGRADLLVVGGPTEAHGMSARMRQFLDALDTGRASGTRAAAFDTRYRMPVFLSGSAARTIRKILSHRGLRFLAPAESFFVTRATPTELEEGEAERAASWAKRLATSLQLSQICAA